MNYTNEEIIKALELIQNTCEENKFCTTCPFSISLGDCYINQNMPKNWIINNPDVWKAFS